MIERTYLQWVGTSFFATVEDYLTEVEQLGVCRKLPNLNVAVEVAKPGTLIFLAHDQGRTRECLACAQLVTCPTCAGTGELDGQALRPCPRCHGLGALERGTGGSALVDGERWTYIRLLRLRKNRAHDFWKQEHAIEQVEFCKACGGRGKVPQGVVFGFYAPKAVVGIKGVRFGESALARLEDAGIRLLGRHALSPRTLTKGSYYAIVPPNQKRTIPTDLANAAQELLGPGIQYAHGLFGRLPEPIPYSGKHFRGIKRWEVPAHIPDEPERGLLEGVA